jgi:hypothetical protein
MGGTPGWRHTLRAAWRLSSRLGQPGNIFPALQRILPHPAVKEGQH